MQYYVYALIDPKNNMPFYIGKGKDKRLKQHFKEADSVLEELTIADISELELDELIKFGNLEKVEKILALYGEGYIGISMLKILVRCLRRQQKKLSIY